MKSFPSLLFWRRKPATLTDREQEITRKGDIIKRAEPSAFFSLLLEEIAVMHRDLLLQSAQSPWHAGGAASLLLLTDRLKAITSSADRIIAEKVNNEEFLNSLVHEEQFSEQNEGSSPHTI